MYSAAERGGYQVTWASARSSDPPEVARTTVSTRSAPAMPAGTERTVSLTSRIVTPPGPEPSPVPPGLRPDGTCAARKAAAASRGWVRANSWCWSREAGPPAYWAAGRLRDGGRGSGGRRRAPGGRRSRDSISRASAAASVRLPAGGAESTAGAGGAEASGRPPGDEGPVAGGATTLPQAVRAARATAIRGGRGRTGGWTLGSGRRFQVGVYRAGAGG